MTNAYWNGEFLPLDQVRISPLDRGFLFADGIYEVVSAYGGRPFEAEAHVQRLQRGLAAVRIATGRSDADWLALFDEMVARSGIAGDSSVYLQVTRGAAANRAHAFPVGVEPSIFAMVSPLKRPPTEWMSEGVAAVTVEDIRWSRCDLKTVGLLGSVLAQQAAVDAGVVDAIQHRDGLVTEGSAANVVIVSGGRVITPPADQRILPGITRAVVLDLAREAGYAVEERDVPLEELRRAEEIWITSTGKEITPVVRLDGAPIGAGRPGPVQIELHRRFLARIGG